MKCPGCKLNKVTETINSNYCRLFCMDCIVNEMASRYLEFHKDLYQVRENKINPPNDGLSKVKDCG